MERGKLPTEGTHRQHALRRMAELRMGLEAVAGPASHELIRVPRVLRVGGAVRLRRVAVLRVRHADGRRRMAVQRQQPGAQPHGLAWRSTQSIVSVCSWQDEPGAQ